jgi:hypothetical protein
LNQVFSVTEVRVTPINLVRQIAPPQAVVIVRLNRDASNQNLPAPSRMNHCNRCCAGSQLQESSTFHRDLGDEKSKDSAPYNTVVEI